MASTKPSLTQLSAKAMELMHGVEEHCHEKFSLPANNCPRTKNALIKSVPLASFCPLS